MTSPSPKPWSSLFYFPSAAFRPFPSPLQAIAQSRPSAVVLFSLSPVDEGLVVNVLSAKESDKELLRSQLWGGAIIRFLHSNENDTATPPFKQSPSIIDSDEIPLATAGLAVAVRVVQLDVRTGGVGGGGAFGDQPIAFEVVKEREEPFATSFREFVEKRVWELEMGSTGGEDGEEEGD